MAGVVAVAGEALMDLVPAGEDGLFAAAPGGSPANVAVGLARLGVPVRMLARISDDLFGRALRAHLERNDVDLSHAIHAREPSSLAIVGLAADGGAEYDFRVDGTADWQWSDEETQAALDDTVVALHTGSLAATIVPGADVLTRLVERARASATVSYDPNCRPLLMGSRETARERVERLVGLADVVKASADDIAWLDPGRPLETVAEEWLQRGPAIVAVTCAADGAFALTRRAGLVRRPARPVEVVDTVGAGDAFTSAILARLWRHDLLGADRRHALAAIPPAALGDLVAEAVLVAAITCGRRGADPPTAAELATTA
jgi:fructokinase